MTSLLIPFHRDGTALGENEKRKEFPRGTGCSILIADGASLCFSSHVAHESYSCLHSHEGAELTMVLPLTFLSTAQLTESRIYTHFNFSYFKVSPLPTII